MVAVVVVVVVAVVVVVVVVVDVVTFLGHFMFVLERDDYSVVPKSLFPSL